MSIFANVISKLSILRSSSMRQVDLIHLRSILSATTIQKPHLSGYIDKSCSFSSSIFNSEFNYSSLEKVTNAKTNYLPYKSHGWCSSGQLLQNLSPHSKTFIRTLKPHDIDRPAPETYGKRLRFKVHYPEDGVYTVKPLPMTKLGGRDPETGRIIYGKIGGGHKRRYRWLILDRVPPESKDPRVEKVMGIFYDPNRTARIAMVGHDDHLRYIIATTSMQKGDIISSTRHLPKMPIRAKEGDAHPIGALTIGTRICCVERRPGEGTSLKIAAGTSALITRKLGPKMVIQVDKYHEYALDPNCLVTVGQVSNPDNNKKHIGSPNRLRWLGHRPGSGLFQKKTGRFGFKRKYKQPVMHMEPRPIPPRIIYLSMPGDGPRTPVTPSTNRVT